MLFNISILNSCKEDFKLKIKTLPLLKKAKEVESTFTESTYQMEFENISGLYFLGKSFSNVLNIKQIK